MKNRIIINADDYGLSHEVNEAIVACFVKHYINQTTIMVNMPYMEEAVKLSISNGFCDKVGLHLNLVEGKPLTEGICDTVFCDKNGFFISDTMKNPKYRMWLDKKTRECVCSEIEAQIVTFLNLGIGIKHVDSHQHAHVNPSILRELLPLLERYGFEDVRLSRNIPAKAISGLKKMLKGLTNKKIISFNNKHSKRNVVAFGSMQNVMDSEEFKEITEMMVHPIMKDGLLVDAFSKNKLDVWWKDNANSFELL